jgi:hypothetical protein
VIEVSGLNSPEVGVGYRTAFYNMSATVIVLGSINYTDPSGISGLVLNEEVGTDKVEINFLNSRVILTSIY